MIETLQLRKEVKCSQERLARLIGVSVKTISRWEQEESHPSLLARQRITEIQKVLQRRRSYSIRARQEIGSARPMRY